MAIFGSRRRAASNPPRYSSQLINNTTPSAASAAALAFTTNQDKTNGGLSSAAAAAALRSHTTSPVPVGQTQTKRMVRKMSNSSVGSSRPGLNRSGSSGSMTERTFRSPSPAAGLNGRANPSDVRKADVPPVPPLPSLVKGSHRRAASLEPTLRIASPGPRNHGRGQSLDRGPRGAPTLANAAPSTPTRPVSAAGAAAMKSSPASASTKAAKLANTNELQRSDSRSSVNFSRPMSPTREGSATDARPPIPIAAQQVNPDAPAPKKKKKKKRPVSEGDALIAANAIPASSTTTTTITPRQGPPPSPSSASARAIAERVLAAPISDQTNLQPITSATDPNTSKKLDPSTPNGNVTTHRRVASDGDAASSGKAGVARAQSLSPSRKPHFSVRPIDLESSERHNPLRGVSPAKSALKHSPSNSVRAESPLPISEDVGSAKKKKSVRVSFDEPRDMPAAAVAATKAADTPANKREVEDFDDVLKPTPALPSFSSARGNRRDTTESMDTSVATLVNEEHSRDQVAGSLLAANLAAQQSTEIKTETPLPPKTTSVEAADIATDESDIKDPAVNLPEKTSEQDIQAQQAAKIAEKMSVPDIAVLPATPGTETEERTLSPKLEMPGTYRESTEVDQAALAAKIAEEEAVEKGEVHHAITAEQAIPSTTAVTAAHIAEEEEEEDDTEAEVTETEGSSDDAMYSDAAEDLDENDTGFVSLNAILETPAEHNPETPPAPVIPRADPLAIASTSAPVDIEPPRTASDWDAATEYWKSLSDQKRTELEAQMRGQKLEDEEANAIATRSGPAVLPTTAQVPKPKKKKKVTQDAEVASAVAPVAAVAAAPALKSAMKKPKEQTAADKGVPTMRRTLRGPTIVDDSSDGETQGQPHVMQKSLRGPRPTKASPSPRRAPAPVESNLATSMHAPKETRSALTKKTMQRTSSDNVPAGIEVPLAKPTLVRSNSAGSDSSFKRSRRRPASSAGDAPISMRRSMRGPPPAAAKEERPMSPVRSSRWSIRSSSPARSETGSRMRMSLRNGSVDAGNRSLRGPKKEKTGGLFGFGGRSSRANSVAGSDIGSPPPSATRSRFMNDSDDEDRGSVMSGAVGPPPAKPTKKAFKSRFADDSDDEIPSPAVERPAPISTTSAGAPALMSPVRGIPRRAGQQDGDSSDLSDDSDAGMGEGVINAKRRSQQQQRERVATKPPVPSSRDIESSMTNGVNHHHNEGSALAAGTMRSSSDVKREEVNTGGKKSGFKGLMSSKHAPPPSANRMTSPAPQPTSTSTPNTPQRPGQRRRLSGVFGFGSSPKNKGGRSSSTPPTQGSYFSGPVPPLPADAASKTTPKLQRRSTPTGVPTVDDVSINAGTPLTEWPLSAPRPGFSRGASGMSGFSLRSNNNRPETSDGINLRKSMRRPDVGKRRSTADQTLGDRSLSGSRHAPRHVGFDSGTIGGDDVAEGGAPKVTQLSDLGHAYGKTGKKKRFQGLRKVFGLRD